MARTKQMQKTAHIRWMIRRDMPQVLAIELSSFKFFWDEEAFHRCLRQRNVIGMVAEIDEEIAGYMIYELHDARLHLLNLAVSPLRLREGIATGMVEKMKGKLSHGRRTRINLEIRETNLDAQLFFRRQGFKCVSQMKDFYDDTTEDAYLFQYRLLQGSEA